MTTEDEYLLGANEAELARLRFQHEVWGPVTRAFLERLGVRSGWKCLDVGAGPGLVAEDLRALVGDRGEVTALEPSAYYRRVFEEESARRGWKNTRTIAGKAEEVELASEAYDLVFARWVLSFAPDPEAFITPLVRALKPGGVIALEDYYYEGLSLFPHGAFNGMHDVVIRYYRSEGGDPYVAGLVPKIFRHRGVHLKEFSPHCLAGGPQSGIMAWADRFFTMHAAAMVEHGAVGVEAAQAMMADWADHKKDPDALFFSPLVVDIAGVKGGPNP